MQENSARGPWLTNTDRLGLIGLTCRFTLRLTPDNRPQGRRVETVTSPSATAPPTLSRFSFEPPSSVLQPGATVGVPEDYDPAKYVGPALLPQGEKRPAEVPSSPARLVAAELERYATMITKLCKNSAVRLSILLGLSSALVDNVPLVEASIDMFRETPTDDPLWQLVALAAGTGGSTLAIGSIAGVTLMSMEHVFPQRGPVGCRGFLLWHRCVPDPTPDLWWCQLMPKVHWKPTRLRRKKSADRIRPLDPRVGIDGALNFV
eukprot:s1783_g13.t1